jgi:hypothetical protein
MLRSCVRCARSCHRGVRRLQGSPGIASAIQLRKRAVLTVTARLEFSVEVEHSSEAPTFGRLLIAQTDKQRGAVSSHRCAKSRPRTTLRACGCNPSRTHRLYANAFSGIDTGLAAATSDQHQHRHSPHRPSIVPRNQLRWNHSSRRPADFRRSRFPPKPNLSTFGKKSPTLRRTKGYGSRTPRTSRSTT